MKSKFKNIKLGSIINLELPLKYKQNISGHICQGHVDTVSKIISIRKIDKSKIYEFKIESKFKKFLVEKASILINGVSLTIAKIKKNSFDEDLRQLVETRIKMTRQKLDNQNLQKLLKKRIEVTRSILDKNNTTQ